MTPTLAQKQKSLSQKQQILNTKKAIRVQQERLTELLNKLAFCTLSAETIPLRTADPTLQEKRNYDMLQLAANGMSLADVGERHKTTEQTVKNRMARFRKTMNARSVGHAIAIAFRAGHIH